MKKPLTWLQRVNLCVRQKEPEYFKRVPACVRGTHGFYLQLMQEHMSPCQLDYSVRVKNKKSKKMNKKRTNKIKKMIFDFFCDKKNLN